MQMALVDRLSTPKEHKYIRQSSLRYFWFHLVASLQRNCKSYFGDLRVKLCRKQGNSHRLSVTHKSAPEYGFDSLFKLCIRMDLFHTLIIKNLQKYKLDF